MTRFAKRLLRYGISQLPPGISGQLIALLEHNVGVGNGFDPDQSGEHAPLRLIRLARKPPLVVFDVGANLGQYTQTVLEQLEGRDFHCYAFEPSGNTYEKFCERHGHCRQVTALNVALSDCSGTATLHMDRQHSGLASLAVRDVSHHGIDHQALTEAVHTRTLDDVCREFEVDHIDLLKIDVEGCELSVLQGGAELMDDHKVAAVQFEFGGANVDTRTFFRDFFQYFTTRKMELYRIVNRHRLVKVARYSEQCERFRCTNVLAIAPSLTEQLHKNFEIF
jgi:FkbM family methyltransferase